MGIEYLSCVDISGVEAWEREVQQWIKNRDKGWLPYRMLKILPEMTGASVMNPQFVERPLMPKTWTTSDG